MESATRTWRSQVTLLASGLSVLVAVLDHQSGPHVSFLLFYLLPIAAVGWRAGPQAAIAVALVAGFAWSVLNARLVSAGSDEVFVWNVLNRTLAYVVVAALSGLLGRQSVLARTDELTGLLNRRGLLDHLRTRLGRSPGAPVPVCVGVLDLDGFKRINDVYGHPAGDVVLAKVADILRTSVRVGDLPARLGGDEFVIVCWRLSVPGALEVSRRLLDRIGEVGRDPDGVPLGASIGIAHSDDLRCDLTSMLEEADEALRDAKAQGKARVVLRRVGPSGATL